MTLKPASSEKMSKPAKPTTVDREPRGARRKRETRQRLLEAALRLMAEKGMEGVPINEITEAADVGFGSFYNHFASKEAIHAALVDQVFEEFAQALDRQTGDFADPAEIIAIAVRHTLRRAENEPLWGRFLLREGLTPRTLEQGGLGRRLQRDIQRGIAANRFIVRDPLFALLSVGGTLLTTLAFCLMPAGNATPLMQLRGEDLPERTAATLLELLGLQHADACEVANRPMPSIKPETPPDRG
jgi:AcrR family transcriptional regulator